MKLSILQENLTKGLNLVSRCVSAKATLPILNNLLLSTDEGKLKLSTTNLEVGINFWLGAKIEKEGSLTIPARILTEFVSSLPSDKIEMESKEASLSVYSGSFRASFVGTPSNEFPQVPSFSGEPVLVFDKNELMKTLSQVVFAAAQDEGRPVLTGVLIKKENGQIVFVATDGYRLSFKKMTANVDNFEGSLLIPAKTLTEIARILQEKNEDKEVKMGLTGEKSQAIFSFPNLEFSTRLLEGDFPDFARIIPQTNSIKAEFDKEEFLRAVKIAAIFAREQANIVKLKIDEGKLVISAQTPQVGENESEVMAKTEGDKLEIAFNSRFLLDFLNCLNGEIVVFEANSSLSPGVFKIKGNDAFLHIIMPVRIQEG